MYILIHTLDLLRTVKKIIVFVKRNSKIPKGQTEIVKSIKVGTYKSFISTLIREWLFRGQSCHISYFILINISILQAKCSKRKLSKH